jgi:hypothetical protein
VSAGKIAKTWDEIQVHAWCLAEGCTKDWQGNGNWPMGAAVNHTRATGHQTRAESKAKVTYHSADTTDAVTVSSG